MNDSRLDRIAILADEAKTLAAELLDEIDGHEQVMLASVRSYLRESFRVINCLRRD